MWTIFLAAAAPAVAIVVSKQCFRPPPRKAGALDFLLHQCHSAAQSLIMRGSVPDAVASLALKINRLALDPHMCEFVAAHFGGPHPRGTKEPEQAIGELAPQAADAMARCMVYGLLASAAMHPSRAEELQAWLRKRLFEALPGGTTLSKSQMGRIGAEIIRYYECSALAA